MLSPIVKSSAGLDVHKKTIVATIQVQTDTNLEEKTREFLTFDSSLRELVKWLQEHSVDCIAMESTGIYWRRLYTLLEEAGLPALAVNARHVKQVPGRKTDVLDSQWLATLARFGLLRGSFIPPKDLRELRMVASYRQKLVGQLSGEKNRLHKLLDDGGIRLGSVVSDINGVSSQEIIQGILDDKSISTMVSGVRGRLKQKTHELTMALDCPFGDRHRFLLQEIQDRLEDLETRILKLDAYLLSAMQPYHAQWKLLQTIPGIDATSAAILITVLGVDMLRFGNMQQLCSWAGMCPGNNESAGKRKNSRTRKGHKLLRQILCQAANAAAKTSCQFKSKYQGLVIRRGHKRSIIALGHKILRVICSVLSSGKPYQDPKVDYTELSVKKNAPRWIRMLKTYGHLASAKV